MKKIVFLVLLIISITYSKEIMNNNNNNNELIKQDVLTTQVMMKLFVDSCLNEYELQDKNDNGLCQCVWNNTSKHFTNKELNFVNDMKQPYLKKFQKIKIESVNSCLNKIKVIK